MLAFFVSFGRWSGSLCAEPADRHLRRPAECSCRLDQGRRQLAPDDLRQSVEHFRVEQNGRSTNAAICRSAASCSSAIAQRSGRLDEDQNRFAHRHVRRYRRYCAGYQHDDDHAHELRFSAVDGELLPGFDIVVVVVDYGAVRRAVGIGQRQLVRAGSARCVCMGIVAEFGCTAAGLVRVTQAAVRGRTSRPTAATRSICRPEFEFAVAGAGAYDGAGHRGQRADHFGVADGRQRPQRPRPTARPRSATTSPVPVMARSACG